MNQRPLILSAGFAGATAVLCGAFGAHALRAHLTGLGTYELWKTAVLYHFIHALALLAIAGWARGAADRALGWAGRAWIAGIVLFSGSLYGLALGGPRWLGPVTPLGGVTFVAGWLLIAVHALRLPAGGNR
jgi:uncharacterized membrane protein YgdD (TMEM256/DUF423 family)